MDRFNDKVALVTGASSGIGKAIVEELLRKGMKVVGLARRMDKMKMWSEEMKSMPGKMYPLQCDITKKDQVMQSMQWIEKNVGMIDILVNNAGMDHQTTFMTGTMDDWQKTFDTNILGLVAITKEFLMMKKTKGTMDFGHIFNINDYRCFTRHMTKERMMPACYMATKWALRGVTDTLRMELKELDSKIKVTNISPGLCNTEMTMHTTKKPIAMALEPRDVAEALLNAMCVRDCVLIRDMIIVPMLEIY